MALLPPLHPIVMGSQSRNFYLGEHRSHLFDTQDNAGTTVWVDGRVVVYWIQGGAGAVQLHLLESVCSHASRTRIGGSPLDGVAGRRTTLYGSLKSALITRPDIEA